MCVLGYGDGVGDCSNIGGGKEGWGQGEGEKKRMERGFRDVLEKGSWGMSEGGGGGGWEGGDSNGCVCGSGVDVGWEGTWGKYCSERGGKGGGPV